MSDCSGDEPAESGALSAAFEVFGDDFLFEFPPVSGLEPSSEGELLAADEIC